MSCERVKISYGDLTESELESVNFDIAVFACGYENRCVQNFKEFNCIKTDRVIIFEIDDTKSNDTQKKNRKVFEKDLHCCPKYFHKLDIQNGRDFTKTILNLIKPDADGVNILIDYSSMPRSWYCSFIHRCNDIIHSYKNINIYFLYRSSSVENVYYPTIDASSATSNIFQFGDIDDEMPKLLLMGLGLDGNGAEALIDIIQAEISLFYTNPGLTKEIGPLIMSKNQFLLEQYESTEIPIANMSESLNILINIYKSKMKDYSILIAPLGPKPMILLSTLLTILYPEIGDIKVHTYIEDITKYFDYKVDVYSIFRIAMREAI